MVINDAFAERQKQDVLAAIAARTPVIRARPPENYETEWGCNLCPSRKVVAIIELGSTSMRGETYTTTRVCGVCIRQMRRELTRALPWAF